MLPFSGSHERKNRMNIKSLVQAIVFAVLGFVFMNLGSYASMLFGPYMMYVNSAIGSFVTAPIFIILAYKRAKPWTSFLFFLLLGAFYLPMGLAPMFVVYFMAGLLAELPRFFVKDRWLEGGFLGLAYGLGTMVVSLHAYFFIRYYGIEGIVERFGEMFTLESAQEMANFYLNWKTLSVSIFIQVVLTVLGMLLGLKIYRRFFGKEQGTATSALGD